MNSTTQISQSRGPCVLVFTAEGLSPEWLLGTSAITPDSALVELDLNSACFERFFLQNVAQGEVWQSLGTTSEWRSFQENLQAAGCSLEFLSPAPNERWTALPASFARQLDWQVIFSDQGGERISQSSDVCWIHFPGILDQDEDAARMIRTLRRLRQSVEIAANHPCTLLILPLRGNEFTPCAPLDSCFPEAECHVPLWIDAGQKHVCRIQQIAGSFDILPTIISLVRLSRSGLTATDSQTQTNVETDQPIDLCKWLKQPGAKSLRNIDIEVQGKKGVISDEYLSVTTQDQHGDQIDRRFHRPEDPWSVNPVVDL